MVLAFGISKPLTTRSQVNTLVRSLDVPRSDVCGDDKRVRRLCKAIQIFESLALLHVGVESENLCNC